MSQPRIGLGALFLGFGKIGLLGFGGIAPWARHIIVEERRWLSEADYAALLGIGQVLPGPNTMNTAVMIGDRFQGPLGALVSLLGLMVMPLAILLVLATAYARTEGSPIVGAAVAGAAAGAAGLVIGMALKMLRTLRLKPLAVLFCLYIFLAIGVLRWPLIYVLAVAVPLSLMNAAAEARP